METITVNEMVIDVRTDDAIMFKPVGPNVLTPMYIRYGTDVYYMLSKDPDGRTCYKLR